MGSKLQDLHAVYGGNVPRGAGQQGLASLDPSGIKAVVEAQEAAFDLQRTSSEDRSALCPCHVRCAHGSEMGRGEVSQGQGQGGHA